MPVSPEPLHAYDLTKSGLPRAQCKRGPGFRLQSQIKAARLRSDLIACLILLRMTGHIWFAGTNQSIIITLLKLLKVLNLS